ncbi:hypothetical protein [Vibrio atlanticus]|uniref:hypothetical protein n=1 Tax=Vibrio atlanticus TaxID=693153 RepID=UPI0039C8B97A
MMTVSELKYRYFFEAMGKVAPSAATNSLPTLANIAWSPIKSPPSYWNKQNLPVGSHFSAARGNDRLLFELAYQLESAKPWANKKAPIAL